MLLTELTRLEAPLRSKRDESCGPIPRDRRFPAASTDDDFTAEGQCVASHNVGVGAVAVNDGCDSALVFVDGIIYRPTG